MTLTAEIKEYALELGFVAVGVAPAERLAAHEEALLARVRAGALTGLPYFTPERATMAADPRTLLPGARSVLSLALSVDLSPTPAAPPLHGLVARYARGADYHRLARPRLKALAERLRQATGASSRAFVDATPLLERAFAARAGLGWFGRHNCLITPPFGSDLMLAEVVTEADLTPDSPLAGGCGECRACLRACPTGALSAPYWQQTNLCLSFLTTELRGPIPRGLRSFLGARVLGCDSCQDACLHNGSRQEATGAFTNEGLPAWLDLTRLLSLDERGFAAAFAGTAATRAKREGLLRNAAVALGNAGDREAAPALARALSDPSPLVRGHAAWALGQLGGHEARAALEAGRLVEEDDWVVEEYRQALEGAYGS